MKPALYLRRIRAWPLKRWSLILMLPLVCLFLLLNVGTFLYYQNKAYPDSSVGNMAVSGLAYSDITERLSVEASLPAVLLVKQEGKKQQIETKLLVNSIDKEQTIEKLKTNRSFIPMLNLFAAHQVPLMIDFNESALAKKANELAADFSFAPKDARIHLENGLFKLENSQNGYQHQPEIIKSRLVEAVSLGAYEVDLGGVRMEPKIKTSQLASRFEKLETQQKVKLTYTNSGRIDTVSPRVISNWYVADGPYFKLSSDKLKLYIQNRGFSWGIAVNNLEPAVSETLKALEAGRDLSFVLTGPKIAKVFTYCTALKGVDKSELAGFESKLAAVYADSKGWSLGGDVAFRHVTGGCQFTAWLAAASLVPSFGAICDSSWSCRVGPNVVINFERWKNGSTAWNSAGGKLDDYRSMVINHETGHWLSFGHKNCPGSGQLAPVMQQQSIDLQGCKFNPWPTSAELSMLRALLF